MLLSSLIWVAGEDVPGDGLNRLSSGPTAEGETEQEADRDRLLSFQQRLIERGVHLSAGYIGEIMANASGGVKRGAIYEGLLELAVELDTEKLDLWKNGTIRISSIYPHGRSITPYVGDLLTVSNIDAYDSMRLYELWIEQSFFDRRFSLRAGQLLADAEFAFNTSAANFVNSAFGWPAFKSGNTINGGPAFYVAAPGVRLRYEPDAHWYWQSGVYDGDPFDDAAGDPRVNARGLHFQMDGRQGAFCASELGFRRAGANGEEPAGEFKLGAWLHTGEFFANFNDSDGNPFLVTGLLPEEHASNYGLYAAADVEVWRNEEREIRVFGRAGWSPPDRNLFELVADAGITITGLLAGRPDDQFGAGVVYARVSRDMIRAERIAVEWNGSAGALSDHETVMEVFYSAQVTPWWRVQPDLQWVFNPGANPAIPDALVIGLRSSIAF